MTPSRKESSVGREATGPADGSVDWLPPVRSQSALGNPRILRRVDIQAQKHRDWFLAFVAAIETDDTTQSWMLAKTYLFLRDFMPHGLTGRYSHISGNELMTQLLCHGEETAASRHKVTTGVEKGFKELSSWMRTNKNWHATLGKSLLQAESGSDKRAGKKKPLGKAPGLRSPTVILAALIIEYPTADSKFKNWVSRLEIDWMVAPRKALSVQHGFWKGLDHLNLDHVFAADTEEYHTSNGLLADYNSLLGDHFLDCRRDIRPFLPQQYADYLTPLTGEQSDIDDISSDPGQSTDNNPETSGSDDSEDDDEPSPSIRAASQTTIIDVSRLRDCLNTAESISEQELEAWLVDELVSDDNKIIPAWCQYWEDKINKVTNYQDQMIVRSLFLHGCRRAKNLYTLDRPLADAFMLVHSADIQNVTPLDVCQEVLQKLPLFSSCKDANDRLVKIVAEPTPAIRGLTEGLFQQQACLLYYFTQDSPFFDHWRSVFNLEIMYSDVVRYGREQPLEFNDLAFLQKKRDILLDEKTVKTLQMTSWQVRALLVPGSETQPLADWQLRVFRQRFCPELDEVRYAVDITDLRAMPVVHESAYPDLIQEKHSSLYKLFGTVKQPRVHTNTPSRPPSAPAATPSHPPPAPAAPPSRPPSVLTAPPSRPPSVRSSCTDTNSMGATQRKPSQGPSTQGVSANPELVTPQRASRMAGKSHFPSKRALSPNSVPRAAKTPRLGGGIVTRDMLLEDLDAFRVNLRGDIHAKADELKLQISNMNTDLESKISFVTIDLEEKIDKTQELLQEDLQGMPADLQHTLKTATRTWSSATNDLGDTIREDTKESLAATRKELREELDKVTANQEELRVNFNKLAEALHKQQDNTKLDVKAIIQDVLKKQAETSPKPGQDGYLDQCKAPSGWDQQAYKFALVRAAWLYICTLGIPDDGVREDETTWNTVLQTFPDFDEDHILMALNHAHVEAYGCLFNGK